MTNYCMVILCLTFLISCSTVKPNMKTDNLTGYDKWAAMGKAAMNTALDLLKKQNSALRIENLIVLTNAGYAEVNEETTEGALDGVALNGQISRGRHTLIEIHSASWKPLWFAVYDKISGYCVYLELKQSELTASLTTSMNTQLFTSAIERVDANYLYEHAENYKSKFKNRIFGGNEFRIITIVNTIAEGAPANVMRAFEFHDHYCPGVTSGVLMVQYLKKHFPPGKRGYFVHTIDPWCKEDALLVLLNATPGKKGYAISYPTDEDKLKRKDAAKDAATIFYRKNDQTHRWEGIVLGFQWTDNECPKYNNKLIDKLCTDLYYLKYMDQPEQFVKVIKKVELPDGVSPKDWARPGIDPMKKLGLLK